MKLIRVSLSLSSKEFMEDKGFNIIEFEITKATDKTLFIHNEDSDKQRISKDRLMKIDTALREDLYTFITYAIYCYDIDLNKAKQMLLDKVTEEVNKRKAATEMLIKNLENVSF